MGKKLQFMPYLSRDSNLGITIQENLLNFHWISQTDVSDSSLKLPKKKSRVNIWHTFPPQNIFLSFF
jgi:hypothetical protein